MKFDFIMDSSCDLSEDIIKQTGFSIIPMNFVIDGRQYAEDYWRTYGFKEFYDALRGGSKSSTSQPSRELLTLLFVERAREGRDILFVPLSSGISGTYENAAAAAAEAVKVHPGVQIIVEDSRGATQGHGLLAITAARLAEENDWDARQTADWIARNRENLMHLFTVDDLMFLHRGGRLSRFSAIAGSMLGIKPMLKVSGEGKLLLDSKVRGRKAAIKALADGMKKCITSTEQKEVTISHGDCLEEAEYLAELIRENYPKANITIGKLGAVIGSHSGPGTIALFFWSDTLKADFKY